MVNWHALPHCRRRSWQSIYAFRGVVSSGMGSLVRDSPKWLSSPLRYVPLPISVVRRAQDRVPHMKWAPWAVEGKVLPSIVGMHPSSSTARQSYAGTTRAGLCPLKEKQGTYRRHGHWPVHGFKTLKKLGDPTMPRVQLLKAIDKWEADRLAKGQKRWIHLRQGGVPPSLRRRN